MPPPVELRIRPQDGISWIQKVAAVELGFWLRPRLFGGTWIYIGGRSTSVEQRGAHEGGGCAQGGRRAPCLVGPSGGHRRTSSSSISLRTLKTSRKPKKNNFHRRNLLYPRDPILEPVLELRRKRAVITEGFYIIIQAPPMKCE